MLPFGYFNSQFTHYMKQLFKSLICAAVVASALPLAQDAAAVEMREHRAIWCTPYLGDWPTSAITTGNAQRHRDILIKNLDRYKDQHINVIYYHVRSMCDAAYDSKYEPWSKGVSGTRGKTPGADPFKMLIEEAHARGIEVYAWLNPYRYCGQYAHEDTPLNYTNTHPEWLIVQDKETILNPALEEVQQRIVDVVVDIMEKYPIDGVVFDDYFYSNPTPNSLDADLYQAAYKADPSVGTQLDWRISNVNSMIRRVYKAIKERAPWMPFGISPAGTASPPDIREYGLEPGPDGDWQYSSIASDPISWFAEGIVDYMSPQIYWPSKFRRLQDWWATAAMHFNRHLYSSVSLSEFNTYGGEEFNAEAKDARKYLPENESGMVFFSHKTFVNSSEKIDGKLVSLGEQLAQDAFIAPVLTPLRSWNNVYSPAMVSNISRADGRLVWDAIPEARYTVYSFAPGEQPLTLGTNLVQICYTNSCAIPEGQEGNTFGVCVYDRYGNEYSMLLEGATAATAPAATLLYPADASEAADLFDFTWNPTEADNILEVSADPDFKTLLGSISTRSCAVNSANIYGLESGNTYYWRVRTHPVNAPATVTASRSFTVAKVAVTAPLTDDAPATPVITWTPAYEGSEYTVEVARKADFKTIDFSATTTETSVTVPAGQLLTGYHYYIRVTAQREGRSSCSATAAFATADVEYAAPALVNPATPGATIHSNQAIEIGEWSGMSGVIIQISESAEFPARTSYKATLRDGRTTTADLADIKVNSKKLEDGATYYVRAYGQYYTQESTTKLLSTPYAESTFVYNSEAGVADAIEDAAGTYISGTTLCLPVSGLAVNIYAADGSCVLAVQRAGHSVDLSVLPVGFYIIRAGATTLKWAK